MTIQFKNNAVTTLSGSINDSQTTINVASSGLFPVLSAGDYFYATMYELSGTNEINIEIIKVTATSGTVWTIARGMDGTTARARNGLSTCNVELRWTAAQAQAMLQKDNNLGDLSNIATARVNLGLGTLATQSASNVAITGGTISGVVFSSLDSQTVIRDNADTTKAVAFEVSGVSTATTRTLTIPNASGTIALTSDLAANYQPVDADLTALASLTASGLIARTGLGTVAVRAITQPAAGITITNGDGVSGNPTLALADDLAAVEALATTGFVRRTGVSTWTAAAISDGDLPSSLSSKTYNGLSLTANATGFQIGGGTASKTLVVQSNLTLAGTDGTSFTLPAVTGTLALNNQTFFLGTTSVAINRASGSLSLTGVNIDGSAGSAAFATSAGKSNNLTGGNNTSLLGSLPYQSNTDATTLLAPNTTATKQFLSMTGTGANGAAPVWSVVAKADVGLGNVENTALSTWTGAASITTLGTVATGTWQGSAVAIGFGGTGATTKAAAFNNLTPTTTLGDLIYGDGVNSATRLPGNTSTTKRFLRQTGNGSVSAAPAWDTLVDSDIPSSLTGKTYNTLDLTAAATGFSIAGGTSVKTLTVSNSLTLAGTDSSTLNIGTGGTLGSAAFASTTAFAPAAGSSNITTLGTIASGVWTGSAIGISYGGTGASTKADGFNALSPVTTLGDLIYGDGANSNARLAGNTTTTKLFLTQTGTGSVSGAPAWGGLINGDIPSALTGKTYNGLTLTANATGFQIAGGTTAKTLVIGNNLTLAGTDGSTLNIGAGGTLGSAAFANISDFAAAGSVGGGSSGVSSFNTRTGAVTLTASDVNTAFVSTDAVINGVGVGRGSGGVFRNTANGFHALYSNTTGYCNTANGYVALYKNTTGIGNTANGFQALYSNTTGSNNTANGVGALYSNTTFFNCTGLGSNSQVTGSNQVQLGDSDTTTYVYGTVQNRSDARDKADIRDTTLGLNFINALRPVDYRWDMREDYKPKRPAELPANATDEEKAAHKAATDAWLEACKFENLVRDGSKKRGRYHHGLVAQELKATLDALGIDFGGYQDHKVQGGEDVLSVGYDELIAPLIKAVQELSSKIKTIEKQIRPTS